MKRSRTVPMLLLMSCLAPAAALATPIAHLTLQSQPGDFIGQGGAFDLSYNSPPDTITAQIRRSLADGSPAQLLFVLDSPAPGNQFALLFFGTDQLGLPIGPGTYANAQRADFASLGHPGFFLCGDGVKFDVIVVSRSGEE